MQAEEEAKIPEREEKELSEAFRLFDLDGNGLIGWDELKVIKRRSNVANIISNVQYRDALRIYMYIAS